MASELKRLQDRAAAVAAQMKGLLDQADRSAEQNDELRKLADEAEKVKSEIVFEKRLAEQEKSLRSVVEPASPAPVATPPAPVAPEATQPEKRSVIPVEIRQILPHYTQLRAFNQGPEDVETAYKVGRWLRGTLFRNAEDLRWCKEHGFEARALGEGSNSAGGALVPEEFAARVIRLVESYGTFAASNVEKVTMTRDTMIVPKRVTGTSAYFIGEGAAVTESQPSYSNVQLIAKKLATGCRLSSEIMEDSLVNVGDAVAMEFATSLAFTQDQSAWIGDGTQAYGGIHGLTSKINDGTHTASVLTADATHTGFETLTVGDFLKLVGRLPLYARQGAAFYVSPTGFATSIARLRYAAGGNTVETTGGAADEQFLGYPVYQVHVMDQVLGADPSKVKVLFGNLGLSSIYAKRREFSVRLYDQVYATSDQLLLQGITRFDVNHHSLGDNSTAGPVVALKTAAS